MSAAPSPAFLLDVLTHPSARRATLRLSIHEGPFIAAHEMRLADHAAASWEALFEPRRHVRMYARKAGGTWKSTCSVTG